MDDVFLLLVIAFCVWCLVYGVRSTISSLPPCHCHLLLLLLLLLAAFLVGGSPRDIADAPGNSHLRRCAVHPDCNVPRIKLPNPHLARLRRRRVHAVLGHSGWSCCGAEVNVEQWVPAPVIVIPPAAILVVRVRRIAASHQIYGHGVDVANRRVALYRRRGVDKRRDVSERVAVEAAERCERRCEVLIEARVSEEGGRRRDL